MRVGITTSIATAIAIGVLVATGGGGGCSWPSCFPDASNTGVPDGTSLTAYSGPTTITVNDTVIDSKLVTSCLTIEAIGVIIRKSRIECSDGFGPVYVDDAGMYTETGNGANYAVTIEDSELNCEDTTATAIWESYVAVYRTEISECENGFSINQKILVEDSYIHDLYSAPVDPHEDGIQLSNGHWTGASYVCCALNATILHNTIFGMTTGDTVFGTSAIISNDSNNGDTNILIEKNLLAGGAATVYCPGWNTGGVGVNYDVIDNHWSTQFDPDVGLFQMSSNCANETISGNVYHETGLPITLD